MAYTFLTGGARSGKSAAAERLAAGADAPVTVVATAEPLDDEMAARIARHRRNRPVGWDTVEEPRRLAVAIGGGDGRRFLLVDCVTLWVANLLESCSDAEILGQTDDVISTLAMRPGDAVVVSNEVGDGIVPVDATARRYRDLLGSVNSRLAASAHTSYLVVAGRFVSLEKAPW
jgi:adenosylcobinamide kinase / adenosylcobinamide-phosphate guanylyltransferase